MSRNATLPACKPTSQSRRLGLLWRGIVCLRGSFIHAAILTRADYPAFDAKPHFSSNEPALLPGKKWGRPPAPYFEPGICTRRQTY
jgi:hypothetical protein